MHSKWLFILHEHSKQLWFRSSLYCVLAVITALLGVALDNAVPAPLLNFVQSDAVQKILEILAASMLIVATFALSVMVQAYARAATTATPRATQLLTEKAGAQNALAAFIGAFLFSIVGLIALGAKIYDKGGIVVLFAVTIFVVVLVVVMLLRWIEQLSRLGRVEESIDLVEAATRHALVQRAHMPFLGGQALKELPEPRFPVSCQIIGYVQYIDMEALQHIAVHRDLQIYIGVLPGSFSDLVHDVAYTDKRVDEEVTAAISKALVVGDNRTFEQDPRFGFVVLAEIAIRALSPALNDPGTAIDVIGTSVRLFRDWARERCCQSERAPVKYDRVWVAGLKEEDFFEDIYAGLTRDAAGYREVCIRLLKALQTVRRLSYPPYEIPATIAMEHLLKRCESELTEAEIRQVKKAAGGGD